MEAIIRELEKALNFQALEFQWFWLGRNGERNEMISAKRFSYKNHLLRKWRSIPESRFPKAEHEEIQKLKDVQQVLKSKSKADKFRFSPSNMKVKKDHMTWYSLSRIKRKKDEMLSATNVVYNSSSVAILSRFSGAIEFLPRQPKRDFIDDEKDLHFKMMIINNIIMMNLIPKNTKASTIGHEVTRYARMLESCGVKATYARKDEDVEGRGIDDEQSCGVKATYARKDEDVEGRGIDHEQISSFSVVVGQRGFSKQPGEDEAVAVSSRRRRLVEGEWRCDRQGWSTANNPQNRGGFMSSSKFRTKNGTTTNNPCQSRGCEDGDDEG
ncbi:hypothetical protein L1987_86806 [Smallanthus sonchifolius]|uniref:Uncharacterized protein n=1 Tax=Smallanthus sonchifolius TaxID=185202 RepID=A0ACB8XZM2_9ASTR|nr:hypothetical protein L1987_86806 [Smallanthus sonchifolius]